MLWLELSPSKSSFYAQKLWVLFGQAYLKTRAIQLEPKPDPARNKSVFLIEFFPFLFNPIEGAEIGKKVEKLKFLELVFFLSNECSVIADPKKLTSRGSGSGWSW